MGRTRALERSGGLPRRFASVGGRRTVLEPAHWLEPRVQLCRPEKQLRAFTQKFGAAIGEISSTKLTVEAQQLKVNVIKCKTDADIYATVFDALGYGPHGISYRSTEECSASLSEGKPLRELP